MTSNGAGIYRKAFLDGLTPDPDYDVAAWSDEHIMLSQKASAEPGRYRTDRTPFLREIMSCLSHNSPVQRVVFMKSAQIGGSQMALNWLGYIMHMAPGPVMIVTGTVELAERFSKQRIQPLIDETPVLRDLVQPARSRDSGNTMLTKEFRAGIAIITGANSPASLRSMPIRYAMLDEIDSYPMDAGDEGDPVALAERRTTTFARRKVFLISTPTTKDTSRVEREFLKSDQRRYFVPCPACNHAQYLKWANVKWEDEDPKTARYKCENCGGLIEEKHKTSMMRAGKWIPTAPGDGVTVGFHINALYSPWISWAEIAREFLESKADAPKLKTFVNTMLGETWEEEYSAKVGAEGLRARAELYEPNAVPEKAFALTAGVDVQDNRLAISIYGWGREEEGWLVSHQEIHGDPGRPEIWKQLDNVLFSTYRHESGGELRISVAALDSGGHFTSEVYGYVRERRSHPHTRVIAIKGQSQRGKPPIGKPVKVDINFRGQTLKHGAELYPVGSDTIKSTIYGRFKHNEPGPGYIHFHAAVTENFWQEITCEKQIVRYHKGFPVREWVKKDGQRNEALDCIVYAYAALHWLYTRFNRATIWDQLERRLGMKGAPVRPEPPKTDQTNPVEPRPDDPLKRRPSQTTMVPNRRRGGFVTGW